MSILQLLPSVHAPLITEALSRGTADASACFSPSISNPLRQHVQISPADRNSPFFAPAITPHWALGRGRKPQSGLLCVARSSHMPQILFYHHAVPERRLTQRFRLLIKAGPPPHSCGSFLLSLLFLSCCRFFYFIPAYESSGIRNRLSPSFSFCQNRLYKTLSLPARFSIIGLTFFSSGIVRSTTELNTAKPTKTPVSQDE